ncbi:MAG TPA: polyprenyl synthetase family protein [Candidatus Peribacterales bacterium]|nr:polyprenyl synthetase family protein [Candidatus Peribacterales bacterium]
MKLDEWYTSGQNRELKEAMRSRVQYGYPEHPRDIVMKWIEHGLSDGHQFRPYLLMALNGSLSKKARVDDDLLKLASAIEVVHQASLIVDDMTDGHEVRGEERRSLHSQLGNGIAATISHTLIAIAEQCVHEANLTPEQKIAVLKLMTQTKIDMASGQYADVLIAEKPDDISWVEWLKQRSYLKTRSLMAMPFTATAILQNQDHSSGVQLTECGHSLGTIYQIGDDVRDFEPEEGQVALSYPLAFLLDDDEQAVLSLISGGKIDTATAEQLGQILRGRKSQILRSAGSEIDELAQTAIDLPSGLQGRQEVQEIIELVRGIVRVSH